VSQGDLVLHPAAWPLLLAAPFVFLVLLALGRARARAAESLVGTHVTLLASGRSERRRAVKRGLFGAALLCGLGALLGPTWGNAAAAEGRRGVDIVVCLDVSRSMLARDQAPTRLAAAQEAIADLARRAGGDRLALVLFAGDAVLSVPLTTDVQSFVQLVDAAGPLSVEAGGTDLGAALETAVSALDGASGEHEVIVVVTDGEDVAERGLRVAGRCAARGIAVHCVGYGSRLGSKIAVAGEGGAESFVRDSAGNAVVSVLDEAGLLRIADATGGVFRAALEHEAPLASVYEDQIVPMARKAFEDDEHEQRENRFQWPLAAAFALLLLEQCIAERRFP